MGWQGTSVAESKKTSIKTEIQKHLLNRATDRDYFHV